MNKSHPIQIMPTTISGVMASESQQRDEQGEGNSNHDDVYHRGTSKREAAEANKHNDTGQGKPQGMC